MTLDELEAKWNSRAGSMNKWSDLGLDEIVWFAQQIATAQEREACASVCEKRPIHVGRFSERIFFKNALKDCASAIRAR